MEFIFTIQHIIWSLSPHFSPKENSGIFLKEIPGYLNLNILKYHYFAYEAFKD
jgi:hypothetical protein